MPISSSSFLPHVAQNCWINVRNDEASFGVIFPLAVSNHHHCSSLKRVYVNYKFIFKHRGFVGVELVELLKKKYLAKKTMH